MIFSCCGVEYGVSNTTYLKSPTCILYKGRPKVDISRSAENESSAESRLWVSSETENSPKVNCHFRPKAETETESDGV